MEIRTYWIYKGTSNFCNELVLDDNLENWVRAKPGEFYDIISETDTIEGGIKVIAFDDHKQIVDCLEKRVKKLREALEFTVKAAEYLYKPDTPLHKDLCPMFYHTLTYEGDLVLIDKTVKARQALKEDSDEETVS